MCDWSEADAADYKVLLGWWRVLSRDYNDTSNCLWRSALTMLTLRRTLILITELRSDLLWRGGFCLIFTLLPGLSQSPSDNEFKSARHKKLTNYAYLEDKSICTSPYLDSLLWSCVSGCWSWSEMWVWLRLRHSALISPATSGHNNQMKDLFQLKLWKYFTVSWNNKIQSTLSEE